MDKSGARGTASLGKDAGENRICREDLQPVIFGGFYIGIGGTIDGNPPGI